MNWIDLTQKMQSLINAHISSEVILALNKENSFKPHRTMSLDLLAELLSCTKSTELSQ
jgi:hypothetical protein